jgi:hypothetical protein
MSNGINPNDWVSFPVLDSGRLIKCKANERAFICSCKMNIFVEKLLV